MVWSLLCFPFFGGICAGFLGRFLGRRGSGFVTSFLMFLSFIQALSLFHQVSVLENPLFIKLGYWVISFDFIVPWSFLVDSLAVSLSCVITGISFLVLIFSQEYMGEDPHLPRFFSLLSFFTFFMLLLVTSGNFFQFFFGWEGVGVCSYLLINFWYTRVSANKSSIKALLVNKVGDTFLLLGIILVSSEFKTSSFLVIFQLSSIYVGEFSSYLGLAETRLTLGVFFLVVGAFGKSAQLGLHTWLPDAMEGPTPVSALLHAATMVTAGVFLILRISPLLETSGRGILPIILCVGGLTEVVFAIIGFFQYDLKKIIAYSTCSQLGYMFFICGSSNYSLGLFHVVTHAGFKALLFMCSGALIHAVSDEQDIRKLGGLIRWYPLYFVVFTIASLSLSGLPFLSGFYSKDLILEVGSISFKISSVIFKDFGLIAAMFSGAYSVKLLFFVFFGQFRGGPLWKTGLHNPSIVYLFIFSILLAISIFLGFSVFNLFFNNYSNFLEAMLPSGQYLVFENEELPLFIKELPLFLGMLSLTYSQDSWKFSNRFFRVFFFFKLFSLKVGFDYLYNVFIINNILVCSYSVFFKLVDKYLLETFIIRGGVGLLTLLFNSSRETSRFYSFSALCVLCIALV